MESTLLKTKPGDVVLIQLDPTLGGEKGKTRPCLVVVGSGHPWNLIVVVPITDLNTGNRAKKLYVPVPFPDRQAGLEKESCIDSFQVRCVDAVRIVKKLGEIQPNILHETLKRLANLLGIGSEHVL
jgi:mRNA interferase MazF